VPHTRTRWDTARSCAAIPEALRLLDDPFVRAASTGEERVTRTLESKHRLHLAHVSHIRDCYRGHRDEYSGAQLEALVLTGDHRT